MAEVVVPASKIEQANINSPLKESLIRAAGVYERTSSKPGPLLKNRYLVGLAEEESTDPADTLQLARALEITPQIAVDIVVDLGEVTVALPMDLILARYIKKVEQTQELAQQAGLGDISAVGKTYLETAAKVVRKIMEAPSIDELTFNAAMDTLATRPRVRLTEPKEGEDPWWDRAIPNVLVATMLRLVAEKRNPQLKQEIKSS